ncbi:MAG TPA: mechanosensitive ion channel domain-containing protein, partial [Puia sp.]|nr:mechanosensitive ion channel domain-containing protein [Puia sp.]
TLRRLDRLKAIADFQFRYVNSRPFYAALVFILSLAPLFDLHAPAIYIETTQLLLMILLTFLFRKRLPRNLFYGWCIFILLFFLLPVTRILGLPVSLQRWANIFQDGLSVALGLLFLFGAKLPGLKKYARPATANEAANAPRQPKLIFYAAGLYVFFNLLAVICNLAGRVTLSQIFGTTAIYAFAQTVSLAVFTQLVVEAFLLQIQTSRVRKNYPEQFDSVGVAKSIRRAATALSVILWLIVFTTNLNLFDALTDLLTSVFTEPRQVGSFSFTFGGIILFLGIIWIANFLQRYITYFFGDTGDDAAIDDKGQRSRLLVTRLILLVAGFLLAVAASGLPIDKITVILGALGVGIGLGLQSIVNNFVSGIILIFDRPLRIGDTVEIGDKRGRVKEIGIRSSTLLTDEGAEVIIPNGDVLSHNIVNWTLSNNHVRVNLSFTINKPAHPEDIQADTIKKIISSNPNVLERREPEVILNSLSSKTVEIKVYFWSKDFGKTSLTAGDIRTAIYEHLDKQGITVL